MISTSNKVYVNLKHSLKALGSPINILLFAFSSSTTITIIIISVHFKCVAPDVLLVFSSAHGMVRPLQLPETAVEVGPPCHGAIDEDNEVHVLCL